MSVLVVHRPLQEQRHVAGTATRGTSGKLHGSGVTRPAHGFNDRAPDLVPAGCPGAQPGPVDPDPGSSLVPGSVPGVPGSGAGGTASGAAGGVGSGGAASAAAGDAFPSSMPCLNS